MISGFQTPPSLPAALAASLQQQSIAATATTTAAAAASWSQSLATVAKFKSLSDLNNVTNTSITSNSNNSSTCLVNMNSASNSILSSDGLSTSSGFDLRAAQCWALSRQLNDLAASSSKP